jgi:hypothetical protein
MHVNVCVGVVVIVLVLVQQSRGGEDREGRRCTRPAGPGRPCGVVHAFATYLSRAHDPGWRVRAGGRSARPGCRLRAGVQACGRVGVWACGRGQSGEARNRPASVRCETRRPDDMRQAAGPATRRLAARTRQRPANNHAQYHHHHHVHRGQCPSASSSQRRHRSSNRIRIRIRTRDANPSAAAGYKRPLGQEGSAQCRHVLSLGRAVGHVIF